MRAFHNDPQVKTKYLERVRTHRALDQLIKGIYWQGGRGCAIGCTIHGYRHNRYEDELGIPTVLAHLEDVLFENLPYAVAMNWPERFLSVIEPGANLSLVFPQFLFWLLADSEHGVIRFSEERTRLAIEQVATLLRRRLSGDNPTTEEWRDAAANALATANDHATSYLAYIAANAASYIAGAADTDETVAIAAGAANANAAAASVNIAGARQAHFIVMADKLSDLLAAAPVDAQSRARL
jgi:hypothetical protein